MSNFPERVSQEVHLSGNGTVDEMVTEALEGQPGAAYWSELRLALDARLKDAIAQRAEIPADTPAHADLEERIAELREQVAALATEEAITAFVEDSVRATLTRPRSPGGWDDEDTY